MNKFALATLAAIIALPAAANACSPKDFTITGFKMHASKSGAKAKLMLSGKLVNNCSEPAGAEVQIIAKDKNGTAIEKESGWPTGSNNIPPGSSIDFNFGALFNYTKSMNSFSAAIISAKTW
jgi:hypothetical protein